MHADPMLAVLALGALAPGHRLGDYWLQSDHQAVTKGSPGRCGRRACTRHVASLTAAQAGLLALALTATDTPAALLSVGAGLTINAVSHWWADRRETLHGLVIATEPLTRKRRFYEEFGGAAHMDQAWHMVWMLPSALAIASPPFFAGLILAASLVVLGVCHVVARRAVLRDARRQAAATAS
jgi:hypothetical protein